MKTKQQHPNTLYTGKVDHVSKEYAYIIVDQLPTDILVTHANLQGAWHGDTVQVKILTAKKPNGKPEGLITSIIKRSQDHIVGQIKQDNHHLLLWPDHKRLHHPILLPNTQAETHTAQKAMVQITQWPNKQALAQGKITKILGPVGSHRAETEAIILQFGFHSSFQPTLIKEANSFPENLSPQEIAQRRDLRAIPTLTIDPDDAQDFDDALSLQTLPNGHYQVGIHIADVSHYVKPNSPIDQEALQRGTSVYLVGETIPMLPERLSNHLCSLKPHQDRPALSVIFEIDPNAHIHHTWIGETIIHSDQRLTYAQAKESIETQQGTHHPTLATLNQLAQILRQQRIQQGAIPFETTDFNIHLDEAGEPIHITPKESSIAHQLIEEFMLLANRTVAQTIYKIKTPEKKHLPFIYRVHDKPDPEKLELLSRFANQLGYTFKPKKGQLSQAYHHLLTQIKGTPHQHTLQSQAIRTMAQAAYTTQPKAHFGLGTPCGHYTHFTSPIRRYPDLVIHRLLKQYLQGNLSTENPYEEVAQHASQRERLAIEAERASINYKQVAYMQTLQGQTFQGLISHIAQWGIYVEIIENKCEGMVRLSDIKSDYYLFEPEKFRLRGKHTGKIYQIGDIVNVQIKTCDLEKRTIDLIFV